MLPAPMLPYGRFREAHPDGVVLQPPGGQSEAASDDDIPAEMRYESEPYDDYFEGEGDGLGAHRDTGGRDDWDLEEIRPKNPVLGLEFGGEALGVALSSVEVAGGVVQVDVGGESVAVFATPDGLHAFFDEGFAFEAADRAGAFEADGTTWEGATGESDNGRALERAPARRVFAFAWRDDHGEDAFYST